MVDGPDLNSLPLTEFSLKKWSLTGLFNLFAVLNISVRLYEIFPIFPSLLPPVIFAGKQIQLYNNTTTECCS